MGVWESRPATATANTSVEPTTRATTSGLRRMDECLDMQIDFDYRDDSRLRSRHHFDILAFGDSLTEGFCHGGSHWHPYSLHLQESLSRQGGDVKIQQAGVSGETVEQMLKRLPKLMKEKEAKSQHFTHIIILGGTNDLGTSSAEEILRGLEGLYTMAGEHGSNLVVVTIPEATCTDNDHNETRRTINKKLRDHAERNGLLLIDLEKEIPHLSLTDATQQSMWDDDLHFSPAGYDRFGALLSNKILGLS